ncbi:MAG: magnesium transporter [Planctomycetota bacterium]
MNPTVQLLEPEVRELVEQRRFGELRSALDDLAPADAADLIVDAAARPAAEGGELAVTVFRLLRRAAAAETLAYLEPDLQQSLIEALGDDRASRALEDMGPDDRAALLDELPSEVSTRLINRLSTENQRITRHILGYPEDAVGRMMTPDYVRVRPDWTVARSLEHIRRYGRDAETVNFVFVIDSEGVLIDDLHIRALLLADPDRTIESLMDNAFLALHTTDDREEAVHAMARYDRTAMPVIDSLGHLVGIVTIDDVTDVAEEEFTEDVHKLGGLEALDAPYMSTRLALMLKKRGGWLAALFITQVLTIGVMSAFGEQLERVIILAMFIPLIISSGGNTGTQAASLLVRALALHEVEPKDWWQIAKREVVIGLCLGAALGVLGLGVVLAIDAVGIATSEQAAPVAAAVAIAIVAIVIWGTTTGSMLPLALERLGLDPATSSSPLVATLMDVSGLVIYFSVATVVLNI